MKETIRLLRKEIKTFKLQRIPCFAKDCDGFIIYEPPEPETLEEPRQDEAIFCDVCGAEYDLYIKHYND